MPNPEYDYQFVLEPIYTPGNTLFAYELLTKFTTPGKFPFTPQQDNTFFQLTQAQKITLFEQQLHIALKLSSQQRGVPLISLNVDKDLIDYLLSNNAILSVLKPLRGLRLEVAETFTFSTSSAELTQLAHYCPLWLDDFGAGNTNLTVAFDGNFEYIKIDKSFFWKYGSGNAFRDVITHLHPHCAGIIVEGIENEAHRKITESLHIGGLQGRMWPSTPITNGLNSVH
ncbi:EAL domain-containing protein [Paramixta manurensis]|uniref:EAL domain-containing protein n=1 Tax=Paramixta manurensis TaxID=2740817 RepID=A0A6M8ULJ8_9GAMM|nr:EAL domain-containing protein [Erwiniaceae bacterium PD-1]